MAIIIIFGNKDHFYIDLTNTFFHSMRNYNNSNYKTTTLKTLFMLSIIPMVLVIGGVIPAYAQTVASTNNIGNAQHIFWDYVPPQCNYDDIVYIVSDGLPVGTNLVDIHITPWPINLNVINNYNQAGVQYPIISVTGLLDVPVDVNGSITPYPIALHNTVPAGNYNIVIDVNLNGYFDYGIDVIDTIDAAGLFILECLRSDAHLELKQNDASTRDIKLGNSLSVVGSNLPNAHSSKARGLFMLAVAATNFGVNTATDLSEKSVWSKEVYIGSDGVFTETITWTPNKLGEYNIILDINNDNTYDPKIDLIDYPGEVGFTVTDIPQTYRNPSLTPSCFGAFEGFEISTWQYFLPGSAIAEFIRNHYGDPHITIFPCPSNIVKFGTNSPLSVHGTIVDVDDFNNDGYDDLAVSENDGVNTGFHIVMYGSADKLIAP